MKRKEGRDYLSFENCIVNTDGGSVNIMTMSEGIAISMDEFKRLAKFVERKLAEEKAKSKQ